MSVYVISLSIRKAEEEESRRKAAEEEAAKKSEAASQQQTSEAQRLQELQVRQALNQQTHAQFKSYAETQIPGDQQQVESEIKFFLLCYLHQVFAW